MRIVTDNIHHLDTAVDWTRIAHLARMLFAGAAMFTAGYWTNSIKTQEAVTAPLAAQAPVLAKKLDCAKTTIHKAQKELNDAARDGYIADPASAAAPPGCPKQ